MPKPKGDLYLRTKRWLRRRYPVPFACRVLLRPACVMDRHKAHGLFWWDGEKGSIWVADTGNKQVMSEVLIEEWVHAIRQATPVTVDYEREAHDPTFWALYGEVVNSWRNEVL